MDVTRPKDVSIHAPRVGCDSELGVLGRKRRSFNSRTPCGVRLNLTVSTVLDIQVSIHAPRVGCDARPCLLSISPVSFNSRTPCGVRPALITKNPLCNYVSIHAPRVGCDASLSTTSRTYSRFNSRTPCGVRRFALNNITNIIAFQFTHPVWGATEKVAEGHDTTQVSIHAPRVGCDSFRERLLRVGGVSIHAPRVGCDICAMSV